MIDNQAVFTTVEFDLWAKRDRLIRAERFLIENYLDRGGRTLEGGTGGGKILRAMAEMGFTDLCGFDFVPAFIEQAKQRDVGNRIRFEVGDAVNLDYESSSYDQVIYLQQILCFIEDAASRLKALQESYRVLKEGGTALFSVLSFDARTTGNAYNAYLAYLKVLRAVRRRSISIQYLPWLKRAGKFNFASLTDHGPFVYWYRTDEICDLLSRVGYRVAAIGSAHQIEDGRMCASRDEISREPLGGMLYLVCKKDKAAHSS